MPVALVAGLLMGFLVAVPSGPVSLMCVRQSLVHGPRFGVAAGFGAASAQGIFATVAITGNSAVTGTLAQWSGVVRALSAIVLVGLGLRLLLTRPTASARSRLSEVSVLATYASTLTLAVTNPLTILPYLAVASGAAAGALGGTELSAWSVPGVMLGAAAWYAALSQGVSLLGLYVRPATMRPLNLSATGPWSGSAP